MFKSPLLAAMVAIALTGCATDGSQGTGNSSGSVAGALSSLGGTGAGKGENRVSAAGDLLNAATVSDAELKSVSAQQMAYSDKQAQVAPPEKQICQASCPLDCQASKRRWHEAEFQGLPDQGSQRLCSA
ncbi:hypothetical protein [Chitinivorax sp. B]|uniref:hypothetical protein n=1 Tax=Chitinivorax sp. B TaxID=2502235 RepID=UPI00201761BB|nr:hypothetical protein [Chitinivorax sp. B]